ncbi:hypothetical protein ABG067_003459 [Albugo candida]|uniref:Uncharacterized protein n=1 Tax=Albugo candida TaxID=65357 RepID=A0A024GQV0_9STRA|nr:unnamed protein product [Albugo candida]|eukprot:CCI49281.1 unnamed protein product [Albugo candida]
MNVASRLAISLRTNGALRGHRKLSSSAQNHSQQHKEKYPFDMHFHVSPVHKYLGTAYGTMLWLWVFWRMKQDGKALLGLEHPWEHGHDHSANGEEAVSYRYERIGVGEIPQLVEE